MKKIVVSLVLLICVLIGFWMIDSHRFEQEVEQFLLAHDVKTKSISLRGSPWQYDVVVVGVEEETGDVELSIAFEEDLHFFKEVFSRKVSVQAKVKVGISPKDKAAEMEIFSLGVGFSTKILIKDLLSVGALEHFFSDPIKALENPEMTNFASEVILEDFVCYLLKNRKPLLSWDKLALSLNKKSPVGGVFRAEADLDLEGLAYGEELWNVASVVFSSFKDAYPESDKILAMLKEPLSLKQNMTMQIGFTAPEDIFVGKDLKTVNPLLKLQNPSLAINDHNELLGKLIDAEVVMHVSSEIGKGDIEFNFSSVIIDEETKQMGYDFHYKTHYEDKYWQMLNKAVDIAVTIEPSHQEENKGEMAMLSALAKTWQHFRPHWKDLSFDYGFMTDVDRKTLQPKSIALKQLALKVDDMSITVGIDNQMIDFSRFGLMGEEKIPVVIHQYQRLLGGLVDFNIKWFEEMKATKAVDMSGVPLPSPQFTKNFLNLVKDLSDDPKADSSDVTITILMEDNGPKQVGTLSVMEVIEKFSKFYEESVVPPPAPPAPPVTPVTPPSEVKKEQGT